MRFGEEDSELIERAYLCYWYYGIAHSDGIADKPCAGAGRGGSSTPASTAQSVLCCHLQGATIMFKRMVVKFHDMREEFRVRRQVEHL